MVSTASKKKISRLPEYAKETTIVHNLKRLIGLKLNQPKTDL